MNFVVLWVICEGFLCEILERGVLLHDKSEHSAKVFSTKIVFSPICESFLPRKFPAIQQLYSMSIFIVTQTINEPLVKRRLMWMLRSVTPLCCTQYKTSTAIFRDGHFYSYPNTLLFSLIPRLLPVFPVEEPGYEATPFHLLPYNLFTQVSDILYHCDTVEHL